MPRTADACTIGVDIGGTFTDAVVVTATGEVGLGKVSTTPTDPAEGFFASIDAAAHGAGLMPVDAYRSARTIAHGTTVGINAIVTGATARTALLTTKGHGDAIRAMGGGGRLQGAAIEELLDYRLSSKPAPVVAQDSVFELTERIDRDGDVVVPLSIEELDEAIEQIRAGDHTAVAIAFLWSFVNPVHELVASARLRAACPGVFVSISHLVAPRIGEHGRTVSTVLNAQIGPLMVSYIDRIVEGGRARGFAGDILFAQAEGGLSSPEEAARLPLSTLQSGPVAGVLGAAIAGGRMGYPDIVVTDMGGTTLDVATVSGGNVGFIEEGVVARQLTFLRKVDVESVGAGGGSIAWIHEDSGGLRVGPQSAGAVPDRSAMGAAAPP